METLIHYKELLLATALSFATAFIVIPVVILVSRQKNLLDAPDHRKQHKAPIPTMGGIGVVAGFMLSSMIWLHYMDAMEALCLVMCIPLLLVTGIWDDMKTLSASVRLLIQVICGLIAIQAGLLIHIPEGLFGLHQVPLFIEQTITVVVIAGVINAYNLIDGIDGLAGGLGLINTLVFGAMFFYLDDLAYTLICFSFGAALLAFLRYNFNPAKIFMGDTGSLVLGFLMVVLGIKIMNLSVSKPDANGFILIVFGLLLIPVLDSLRVFLFRALKSKSPFSADRSHIHHLLLKTGFDHKKASIVLYHASVLLLIIAYALRNINLGWAMIMLVLTAVLLVEILSIKRMLKIRTRVKQLYADYKDGSADNQLLMKYLKEKDTL